jgi:hypothetical protein
LQASQALHKLGARGLRSCIRCYNYSLPEDDRLTLA